MMIGESLVDGRHLIRNYIITHFKALAAPLLPLSPFALSRYACILWPNFHLSDV